MEGSTISGFGDAFAQAISYTLPYGVSLGVLVDKFSHQRFEPAGITKNPEVRVVKSIIDYIFRRLATKFLSACAQYEAGVNVVPDEGDEAAAEQLALDPDAPAAGAGERQGPDGAATGRS